MPAIGAVTTGVEVVAATVIEELNLRMPAIAMFSTDVSSEARMPQDGINVPYVGASAVGDWNASSNNYVRAAASLKGAQVKLDQRKIAGFAISQDQLVKYNPAYWQNRGRADARAVGRAVFKSLTDLVTAENFGDETADKITVASKGLVKGTAAELRKAALAKSIMPEESILALSPDLYSDLLALYDANTYGGREAILSGRIPSLLGFGNIIQVPSLPSGGFIAKASALCFAARAIPVADTTPYQSFATITDEELGMPMNVVVYTDGATGTTSYSVEALFGAAVGDPAALVRIIQA